MAEIVGAFASSHGPLLATQPGQWDLRAEADRRHKGHWFRGKPYDFEALLELRKPGFSELNTPAERTRRYDACQHAIATVAALVRDARPDVAIIFGNDQEQIFHDDFNGAFTIFSGAEIPNRPMTAEQKAGIDAGLTVAEYGYSPPEGAVYAGAPEIADSIVAALLEQEFDVAVSQRVPDPNGQPTRISHAFGFIYRRFFEDRPPPSVPIFINVGVHPNRPRLSRIVQFGHAAKHALDTLPADLRVVVFASGGLSHLTVDEDLDRDVIRALQSGDEAAMLAIPEAYLEGNSCEIKTWFAVAALMNDYGRRFRLIDYIPCYRSPAGTGHGMAFASWD